MKGNTLISILNGFQKLELEDLGNILGSDVSSRMKKSEMVARLAGYLEDKPRRWLSHLMERDIRLLKRLVHAGPEKVQYLDFPDYPSILEMGRLVEWDDSDQNYHKVWIRREVYDIVAPHVDQALHTGEKSGRFEIERVGLGYLNLYGVLPTDHFLDLMADYFDTGSRLGFDELVKVLRSSPLIKLCRYTDAHGDYLCSPCVADPEGVFQMREEAGLGDRFHRFTREEVYEAGSGAPYFNVSMKTPEGKALEAMLRQLDYEGFDLVKTLHDIWMEAQDPVENEALYDVLFDNQDRLNSYRAFHDCFLLIAAYANCVPKWVLNGFSAAETGHYLVEEGDCPDWQSEELEPLEDGPEPWTMPRPTISEGYTDEIEADAALKALSGMLPEGFPFGLAIPHVAQDDPCPCGSGLRYGHCHGKNLN